MTMIIALRHIGKCSYPGFKGYLNTNANISSFCSKHTYTMKEAARKHNYEKILPGVNPQTVFMVSDEEKQEFLATFPNIVRDLTLANNEWNMVEANKRFAKLLNYLVPHGKLNTGLVTIATYKALASPEDLTVSNNYLVNMLAWCTELIIASYCVTDDMADGSNKRRGKLCWHLNNGVGMKAVNDGHMLHNCLYLLLKKYFHGLPCYVPLLELFRDLNSEEIVGQSMDGTFFKNGKPILEAYTMDRINALAKYKTSSLLFRVPVFSALYFCDNYDSEAHNRVNTILYHLGEFCRIQDDVLDCYGDSAETGKDGNDIRMGKCSWLVVEALNQATPYQRLILEENYGKPNPKCEESVLLLYEELAIVDAYLRYKEERHGLLCAEIKEIISDKRIQNLLYKIVEIYMKKEFFFK